MFRHGIKQGFSLGQADDQGGVEPCLVAYSKNGVINEDTNAVNEPSRSTEIISLGRHRGLKTGQKGWKVFCRENAAITVEEHLKTDPPLTNQAEVNWHIAEELTYWTP